MWCERELDSFVDNSFQSQIVDDTSQRLGVVRTHEASKSRENMRKAEKSALKARSLAVLREASETLDRTQMSIAT